MQTVKRRTRCLVFWRLLTIHGAFAWDELWQQARAPGQWPLDSCRCGQVAVGDVEQIGVGNAKHPAMSPVVVGASV